MAFKDALRCVPLLFDQSLIGAQDLIDDTNIIIKGGTAWRFTLVTILSSCPRNRQQANFRSMHSPSSCAMDHIILIWSKADFHLEKLRFSNPLINFRVSFSAFGATWRLVEMVSSSSSA